MPENQISSEEKKTIINVHEYFKLEAERGRAVSANYAMRIFKVIK